MSCKHMLSNGSCKLGKYGGKPANSICMNVCTDYKGPPRGAGDLVKMAVNVATLGNGEKISSGCSGCKQRQIRWNNMTRKGFNES